MGHSHIGPSSAERWVNCPGSVSLCQTAPKQPPSEFAAEGTVAHGLAEQLVTGSTDQLALASKLGTTVKEDGFDIEITDEMIEAVIEYNDLVHGDLKDMQSRYPGAKIHARAEVEVKATSVDEDLWGTADHLTYKKGGKLIVYDFKYGKGVEVSAECNLQMSIYAIAAMDTAAGDAFDEVELVVHQPRVGGSIKRWTVPAGWLEEVRMKCREAIALMSMRVAPPFAAGAWCRWCAAKPVCPKLHEKVQEQAMVEFAAIPHPVSPMPRVDTLSVEQLAQVLTWEEPIEGFLKSVRERVHTMLCEGKEVPGFKLVDGRSTRKFTDEKKVVAAFAPVIGEAKLYEPRKLLSPAKLEKIVGKGKLDEFTEKTWGAKSVAPISDPRPAVNISSAADDFAALPPPLTVDEQIAQL